MKIRFVLGQLIYNLVFDLNEIEEVQKEYPGILCFSKEEIEKVKRLEINPHFEKEILKSRKNIGISDVGLGYDEFKSHYYPFNCNPNSNPKMAEKEREFNRLVNCEINRITSEYICDHFVKKQIKSILLSNIVLPSSNLVSDFGGISIHSNIGDNEDIDENITNKEAVLIKITSRVSPEAIIRYIGDEQIRIKLNTFLKLLPKHIKKPLTEEMFEIYKMKSGKNKITFEEMHGKTAKRYDDKEFIMESDTLKHDYSKDINILFRKKRQKSTRKIVTK
jgi:hypothetical protein